MSTGGCIHTSGMTVLSIRLPSDLHRLARIEASSLGLSLTALIRQALEDAIRDETRSYLEGANAEDPAQDTA